MNVNDSEHESPLEWTSELATGVPEIDAQHRELFAAVDALVKAIERGDGRAQVARTMKYLEHYVLFHFSTEECWMQDTGYPGLAEHRAAHNAFIGEFLDLRQQEAGRDPFHATWLPLDLHFRLVMWLREHVVHVDGAFAEFLAARGSSAGGASLGFVRDRGM